jgi:probable DNA metabolism protein
MSDLRCFGKMHVSTRLLYRMEAGMKIQRIYQCENSIDGIFTAIYLAWSSKYGHDYIKIEEECENGNVRNMELFSEYVNVETDYPLAEKVSRSIREKISLEAYQMICRVALSDYSGRADLIYRFLIIGFSMGISVINYLSNEVVANIYRINRNVNNEVHHLLGFVRFSEQDEGVLVSIIHPKNNVLSLIAPHFADRLIEEQFIIFDGNRNTAALHIRGVQWIMVNVPDINRYLFEETLPEEMEYRKLWKTFCKHIAIQEHTNNKLQQNNLPLRFRADMTEFD